MEIKKLIKNIIKIYTSAIKRAIKFTNTLGVRGHIRTIHLAKHNICEYRKQDKKKENRTIEDDLYIVGAAGSFLILIAILVRVCFPGIWGKIHIPPCLFQLVTGYYCPGCGGTRAVRALLHGNILQSVYYHPFVLYGVIMYLYFMLTQTIERRTKQHYPVGMRCRNVFLWAAVAIILVNFLIKNILHYQYGFIL